MIQHFYHTTYSLSFKEMPQTILSCPLRVKEIPRLDQPLLAYPDAMSLNPQWRHCQRNLACDGAWRQPASDDDQAVSLQVLQDQSRDHPPRGDAVCPVSAVPPSV